VIRVYTRRGSRPGDATVYLRVPREIVRAFHITPDDAFELSADTQDSEITLCYKRVKKIR